MAKMNDRKFREQATSLLREWDSGWQGTLPDNRSLRDVRNDAYALLAAEPEDEEEWHECRPFGTWESVPSDRHIMVEVAPLYGSDHKYVPLRWRDFTPPAPAFTGDEEADYAPLANQPDSGEKHSESTGDCIPYGAPAPRDTCPITADDGSQKCNALELTDLPNSTWFERRRVSGPPLSPPEIMAILRRLCWDVSRMGDRIVALERARRQGGKP